MNVSSKSAVLAVMGVLALGASLAFFNTGRVPASEPQPQAATTSVTCKLKTPCFVGNNKGNGAGIQGISLGNAPASPAYGAVQGSANGLNGAYIYSAGRNAGFFENGNDAYFTLYATSDASDASPLGVFNSSGAGFSVDGVGDGVFTGTVTATGYITDLRTRDGRQSSAYLTQAARATIEDTGSARLERGTGIVRFDPTIVTGVDFRAGYQVFLTPNGDTRGLYVASKYQNGFIVRESQGGRSSIAFDWRVVARPFGASEARVPHVLRPSAIPGHVPQ